jgi:hypothetical protein
MTSKINLSKNAQPNYVPANVKSKIMFLGSAPTPEERGEIELNEFLGTLSPSQIISVSIVPLIGANTQKVIIIHS